jgi:anaerobic ribonucleoside-triphosphate reductase
MIELKGKVAERFDKEREKAEKSPKTDVSENVEVVRQIVSETKGGVGMGKEELAKQYADNKVEERKEYPLYDLRKRKELTRFDGYDIEQAYEDGYERQWSWLLDSCTRLPVDML